MSFVFKRHLNFSPVIVHDDWLTEYEFLFDIIDNLNNDDVYTSWSATFSKLANQLNFLEDDYQIKIV